MSDAKVTDPDSLRRGPLRGALKLVIVNRGLCVGYAGKLVPAQDALRLLPAQDDATLESVVRHFLDAHEMANRETDFLIGTTSPLPSLTRISNGSVEHDLDAAWIGDQAAFEQYQQEYHSTAVPTMDALPLAERAALEVASRMTLAFGQFMRSATISTVGDFVVSVISEVNGFHYAPVASVSPVQQAIPDKQQTVIRFGTRAEGGYGYSILVPKREGVGVIGVHFYPGDVGALFHPRESESAIVYAAVSHDSLSSGYGRSGESSCSA